MKHLASALFVAVVTIHSAIGAAGPVDASHGAGPVDASYGAGMPPAAGIRPIGPLAALHRVPANTRPARVHLSWPELRHGDAMPIQGFPGAFSRPDIALAPSGTAASAASVNPWAQQAGLSAADAASGDMAGFAMALSGDTALIGAPGKDGSIGAVYVYVHNGARWIEQARLSAGDGIGGDQFGFSVALSGGTALVGAPFANHQAGAAYIFVRRGTRWQQQARLSARHTAGGDWFGAAVALSGSTAVVGAPQGNSNTGVAYVFVHSGSGWEQQVMLAGSGAAAGDDFGFSVALSGDSAIIGAPQTSSSGAAYVFVRRGIRWSQQAMLATGNAAANGEFGTSVALSGSTALVGAPGQNSASGAAYVFVRRGAAWRRQARLTAGDAVADANVGLSVALSGSSALVGAPGTHRDSGAMYVFARHGTGWYEQIRLTAGDAAANDEFGTAVALHGNIALVGAPRENSSGTAYVLVHGATNWSQQAGPTAGDTRAGDQFSFSLAASGASAVVGAPGNDGDAGAAYVFVHSGAGWRQQARLTAGDGAIGGRFGFSVALAGSIAVVGAPQMNDGAGAAYVFVQSGAGWRQQARLRAVDGAANDQFGFSVALSGDTALVAAPGRNGGIGAVYVFVQSGMGWHQQARLSAADGAAGDQLGFSVALSEGTALVGAPGKNSGAGAAYVFMRSRTGWVPQARLNARDSLPGDELGTAVALSGNTLLVGAAAPFNTRAGAAYVFVRKGASWHQQARLSTADGAAGDEFGLSVALSGSGDAALVGAPFNTHAGAAYVFMRSGTNWRQQARLGAADGAAGDHCGLVVTLGGADALVGAPGTNGSTGAVYVVVPGALSTNP